MTPKEQAAMQQALEALEEIAATRYPSNWCEALHDEITALRSALADSAASSGEALAEQAEQEPVAWISSNCPKCKNKVKGAPDSGWVWRCPKCAFEWPVDNAAHVRTKDMTDDELKALWENTKGGWLGLFRAVIAADREKNK